MLIMYVGWSRGRKLVLLAHPGCVGADGGWHRCSLPCHPKSVPICSHQSLSFQWCNRLSVDFLTSWFRWDLTNQSGNKVERSQLPRNAKCYGTVWAMPSPLQSGFNKKCSNLSWPPNTTQKVKLPTAGQKLAPQSLLSPPLPRLLLYINCFQCPVHTKPEVCGQGQESPVASKVGFTPHPAHCPPQEQKMLEECYRMLL